MLPPQVKPEPAVQVKSLVQISPCLHCTSAVQVSAGMQAPLFESQIESLAQSAVEAQRSLGWQKPAALQVSVAPQEASDEQPQRPVARSQVKPEAHLRSPLQRFAAPFLHAGSAISAQSAATTSTARAPL